ncbi:hypothetical protein HKX48_004569 [Thoreauomyces humboldtii]|nr:hypothetical protein HKX48_004569 [Thoreauomyces humboldtii]
MDNFRFSTASSSNLSSDSPSNQQHQQQHYGNNRATSPASSSATMSNGPMQLAPHDDGTPGVVYSPQNQALLDQAEMALRFLSDLSLEQDNWKPVLTHRTGAVVYRTNKVAKGEIAVFKGVAILHGFAPDAIFALVKNRQLWDNWYLEGHVVDNINDLTSLSYMVMKPQSTLSQALASTRDLALVDRKAYSPVTGAIAYASTSCETPKIPKHPGRVRALLKLNGWVLEPQTAADGRIIGTKVSYYIQTDVGGVLPGSLVKRYLARRALVVVGVEDYLRKHGAPAYSEADSRFLRRATMAAAPLHSAAQEAYPEQYAAPNRVSTYAGARPDSSSYPDRRSTIGGPTHTQEYRQSTFDPRQVQSRDSTYNATQSWSAPDAPSHRHERAADRESLSDALIYDEVSEDGESVFDDHAEPLQNHDDMQALHQAFQESVPEHTIPAFSEPTLPPPQIAPEPSTNPHNEAAQLSLRLLQALQDPEGEGWVFHGDNGPVRIAQKVVAGAPLPMVRGDALIKGSWSPQQILSVIKSATARKTWDGRFEDGRALVYYNLDESLIHSQQKGTFPVSGRDFVTSNLIHYAPDGTIFFTATSVVDQSAPVDNKRVRAQLAVAGWILKPVQGGVMATYIVQVDIKGSVPSSIIKAIQTQTPMCIAEVLKYLQQHGFVPFIVRNVPGMDPARGLKLRNEELDAKTSAYKLEYRASSNGTQFVVLALPESAYGKGAQVTVSPAEGVTVHLVDNSETSPWHQDGSLLLKIAKVGGQGSVDIALTAKPGMTGWQVNGQTIETESAPVIAAAVVAKPQEAQRTVVEQPAIPAAPKRAATASAAEPASPPAAKALPRAVSQTAAPVKAAPAPAAPVPALVARPTYVPHRHTESGVKALKYLKQIVTDESAWKFHSEQQGIKISTIEDGASAMPIVRGDATFPPEYSVDDIMNVLRTNGARKIWDARFEDGEMMEWLNTTELVFHSVQKGQFPVSARDICGLQVTLVDARSTTYVVATSVIDPLVPVDSKRVRADLTVAGWILKPANNGGVAVTYVVKIDVRGSIPSAIVKAVSIQTPLCVAEVLKYLKSSGPPPVSKVLGNTGEGLKVTLKKDKFDHKTSVYDVTYDVQASADFDFANVTKAAGLVEIQIDPRAYPAGVDLAIPDHVVKDYLIVKSSPDQKCIRLYLNTSKLLPSETARIDVKLTKARSGRPDHFTVNGRSGSVIQDESNTIMITIKKSPVVAQQQPAVIAPGASRSIPAATSSSAPRASSSVVVPAPGASSTAAGPVKRRAQSISAGTKSPPPPYTTATSTTTTTTSSEDQSALAYVLTFVAMILRLLRPFLAPNAGDLPDGVDPSDLRAIVKDSEPVRLAGAAVVGSGVAIFAVRWIILTVLSIVGSVLGLFSFGQWIFLAVLGSGAAVFVRGKLNA